MPSAKYGLEQFVMLRSVFGSHGSRIILVAMSTIFSAAWAAILAIMLGHGAVNILNGAFDLDLSKSGTAVSVVAVIAVIASWIALWRGPISVERVSWVVAPILFVILIAILIAMFSEISWAELAAFAPLEPEDSSFVSFMLAIELGLAGGFAWWPNMGNLARLTRTPRAAFWPNWIGIFGASVFAAVVGCFAALALEITEPTDWLIPLLGLGFGIVCIACIAFANITAILSQGYGSMVALRSGGGSFFARISWPVMGLFILGPAAVLVFFPDAIYNNYDRFLSWGAIFVAPLTGIGIADYFLLRRGRLPARELFAPVGSSAFTYWRGYNPVAFIALAAGAVTYSLILHPITYVPSAIFPYTTASIPAFLVGGGVYVVLTMAITRRRGQGGFDIPVPTSTGLRDVD